MGFLTIASFRQDKYLLHALLSRGGLAVALLFKDAEVPDGNPIRIIGEDEAQTEVTSSWS